jgi:hypothetical protein
MEFKNINEALKYISLKAKAYPSEIDYYSSEEYKRIYHELCRVNRLLQEAYNVHRQDVTAPLRKALFLIFCRRAKRDPIDTLI